MTHRAKAPGKDPAKGSGPDQSLGPAQIEVKAGSIYLSAALTQRYFANLEAVILLRQDDDLVILPVRHAASGGYLLKVKNAAGDRVINAMDFFRFNGDERNTARTVDVVWSSSVAGLTAAAYFKSAN